MKSAILHPLAIATPLVGKPLEAEPIPAPPPQFRFESLRLAEHTGSARRGPLALSLLGHLVLIVAVVVLPLLWYDTLPTPGDGTRVFFVSPPEVAAPPPPPPPPLSGLRASSRTATVSHPVEPVRFVAPVETPIEVKPEEGLDIGAPGGVPGGVEGGVPGGVIGGIVGGLPSQAAAPAAAPIVRVGGKILAPKLVHRVSPDYPQLATQAHRSATIVLEATVDTRGAVNSVRVLRGAPLFDEPAVAAVQQWRYQPLLLNGVPTEFVVTITLVFNLVSPNSR